MVLYYLFGLMKFLLIFRKFLDLRKFYRVVLKIRSNRVYFKILIFKGGRILVYMRMILMILKRIIRLLKWLNNDIKYFCSFKLYIFSNIFRVKRMIKNKLVIVEKIKVFVKENDFKIM